MFLLFQICNSISNYNSDIYIPICFYYFKLDARNCIRMESNLHSNMFILFHHSNAILRRKNDSFTFQYVSIISMSIE